MAHRTVMIAFPRIIALVCTITGLMVQPAQALQTFEIEAFQPITPENAHRLEQVALLGGGRLREVVWSPDGETIAVSSQVGVWLYEAGDVTTEPQLLVHPAAVTDLAFHPNGATLATSATDGSIRLWDMASGAIRTNTPISPIGPDRGNGAIYALTYSPDGRQLAAGAWSDAVKIYDAATLAEQRTISSDVCRYYTISLAFSPDGNSLACVTSSVAELSGGDGVHNEAGFIDLTTDELLNIPYDHAPTQAVFDPNGERLLIEYQTWDGETNDVAAWDTTSHTFIDEGDAWWRTLVGPVYGPPLLRQLATNTDEGLAVVDADTGRPLAELPLIAPVLDKTFSPRGNAIAYISNNRLFVWSLANNTAIAFADYHSSPYVATAISPNNQWLAAMTNTGQLRMWDLADNMRDISPGQNQFGLSWVDGEPGRSDFDMLFSSENHRLVVWSESSGAVMWHLAEGQVERLHLVSGLRHIFAAAFTSPDELTFVGCPSPDLKGKQVRTPQSVVVRLIEATECSEQGWLNAAAFSADGTRYSIGQYWPANVITRNSKTGAVLDVREPDEERELGTQSITLALSSDARWIAEARGEPAMMGWGAAVAILWAVDTDEAPLYLSDPQVPRTLYYSLVFDSDALLLAAGDGYARSPNYGIDIWNTENGLALALLDGHTGVINDVAFSPDNRILTSASSDGTIRLWGVRSD